MIIEEDGEAYYESEWTDVPLRDVRLLRSGPEDGRVCGLLIGDPGLPIPFFDAPDGNASGHVFPGEQCMLLETAGDWVRVRAAAFTGWVRAACFVQVRAAGDETGE